MDSEMILTFYSAFTQAESESISMNIKLGYKAKMKRGEACSITNKRKRPIKDGKPTDYSKYSLRYPFSSKIVCGYCGAIFTRKMGRAKQDGTRTPYWAC